MQTSAGGTGRGIAEFQGGGSFLPPFGAVSEDFQKAFSFTVLASGCCWLFWTRESSNKDVADILNVHKKCRGGVWGGGNGGEISNTSWCYKYLLLAIFVMMNGYGLTGHG